MAIIELVVSAVLFILSSGLLFNERFRRNIVLVGLAGIIAIVSTLLLLKQGIEYMVDRRISEREAREARASPSVPSEVPDPVRSPPPEPLQSPETNEVVPATDSAAPVGSTAPPIFHVAFFEGQSTLMREGLNVLAAAAIQNVQNDRFVRMRLVSLGPVERTDIWLRRTVEVKDELIRLGVHASRIRSEGTGPVIVSLLPKVRALSPVESKRPLRYLVSLDVQTVGGAQPAAVFTVKASARTAGWRDIELRPLQTFAPEIGMRSFTIVGVPPVGPLSQAPTSVIATHLIDPLPGDVKTIRVLSEQNEIAQTFR